MIKTLDARFDDTGLLPVKTNITPQEVYKILLELPKESLAEIWEFVEFLIYKKQRLETHSTPSQQDEAYAAAMQDYLSRPAKPLKDSQESYPPREELYDRGKFC
ncbi:hypothetical protein PN36_12795 [Candidatus Thiomargarita nelsonii]|uniref:DUF2281 domain-containing protein n=1 Tax=Candidatus Thiomargarita nelsonii TaxID=1003181 RepID=A0A0A6P9E5_9GAMM|nr:hypothetical protein PN36_12795 [Candidatus Thiomargarita nelsonii]